MLLEFSVENFMCFKNEVAFSFEAMQELSEDKFYNPESRRDIRIEGIGLINTVNAIYGKNGIGKTALLKAIELFCMASSYGVGTEMLVSGLKAKASFFDSSKPIIFKYQLLDKKNAMQNTTIHFGNKGDYLVITHKESSGGNLLYTEDILPFVYSEKGFYLYPEFKSEEHKKIILEELKESDIDIVDFFINSKDEIIVLDNFGNKKPFQDLSKGTKKYFTMISYVLLRVFKNGSLYVVDDLDASLHPLLVRRFIEMFKSKQLNPKNARLLFSTNDVMSLHQSSLNGDQIWFMDRDKDSQETKLYSPADYSDFEPLNLQRDYILGCYDATPNTSWRGNCWIGGVEC